MTRNVDLCLSTEEWLQELYAKQADYISDYLIVIVSIMKVNEEELDNLSRPTLISRYMFSVM